MGGEKTRTLPQRNSATYFHRDLIYNYESNYKWLNFNFLIAFLGMLTKYFYHPLKGGLSAAQIKVKSHPSKDIVKILTVFCYIVIAPELSFQIE